MIGLMDCNNFFVSCERLFRPDLKGKPVAVLSSNDGCIVARSQEVKDLGIPMGAPFFQVQEVCKKHNVVTFSSNLTLYRDISKRVMQALKDEFEMIEIYSVDEAFFEFPNNDIHELGEIRGRIMQKTGIPVSIGIATTKTLAKVANGIAKKRSKSNQDGRRPTSTITSTINDGGENEKVEREGVVGEKEGVCVLSMDEWHELAKDTPCGSIWGIGRQTSAFLTEKRISTVAQFLALDRAYIRQSLGVMGERLAMELSGISIFKIGDHTDESQESYASTRSFKTPTHDKLTLRSALGYHAARVAEKLREDECVAHKITIVAKGSRYGDFAHRKGIASIVLDTPTNDTFVLTTEVSKLLNTIFDSQVPYKKAGVIVSGIEPKSFVSNSLFSEEKQTETLGVLQDLLNQKFGRDTIRQAITLHEEKWQERKESKSPDYTTRWNEIRHVKAI